MIVELPAATPVTTPVEEFIVATPGVPLLQVPPVFPLLLKLMVAPVHTVFGPLIVPAFGIGFTVTSNDANEFPQLFDMK